MQRNRLSMRKIREILRLKWECHCSYHLIAKSVGVSSSTASECVRRANAASLSWPLPDDMDDEQLNGLLYPPIHRLEASDIKDIDWSYIHQELKRKHVTLMLLWQEYKVHHPNGCRYSQPNQII